MSLIRKGKKNRGNYSDDVCNALTSIEDEITKKLSAYARGAKIQAILPYDVIQELN